MKIRQGSIVHCKTIVNSEVIGIVTNVGSFIVDVIPTEYFSFNFNCYNSLKEIGLFEFFILKNNICRVLEY